QKLCVDSNDTESDGGLAKPIVIHSSTGSRLFQAIENAFSAISTAPSINKGQGAF
ncbi:hypothetical protein ALC57_05881, partial [Trachymyrmex cornetzi]